MTPCIQAIPPNLLDRTFTYLLQAFQTHPTRPHLLFRPPDFNQYEYIVLYAKDQAC